MKTIKSIKTGMIGGVLFSMILLYCQNVNAQVRYAEVMPEFPGGTEKMYEYLKDNLQYPAEALEKQVEGLVLIVFTIETDGSIHNPKVERSELKSPEEEFQEAKDACEKEGIRVISNMPAWKPALTKGKPVSVVYMIPIQFALK